MWNKLLKIALISVSVWEDEEVLEMDGGDVNVLKATELYTYFEMVKMVNFRDILPQ